eukprot:2560122-Prymnesium_polylepis.1
MSHVPMNGRSHFPSLRPQPARWLRPRSASSCCTRSSTAARSALGAASSPHSSASRLSSCSSSLAYSEKGAFEAAAASRQRRGCDSAASTVTAIAPR